MPNGLLSGLLGTVDSYVTPAKRTLASLLKDPVGSTQQTLGLLDDRAKTFTNALNTSREGGELARMNSVMAGLPQYRQASDYVTNALTNQVMNFAPIGMTKQYSPDMSAQQVAKIRNEFHKVAPNREIAEQQFSQWLAKPAQLSAEDIAATRAWFHERAPNRDLAERQFSQWLAEKGLMNP